MPPVFIKLDPCFECITDECLSVCPNLIIAMSPVVSMLLHSLWLPGGTRHQTTEQGYIPVCGALAISNEIIQCENILCLATCFWQDWDYTIPISDTLHTEYCKLKEFEAMVEAVRSICLDPLPWCRSRDPHERGVVLFKSRGAGIWGTGLVRCPLITTLGPHPSVFTAFYSIKPNVKTVIPKRT